MKSKFTLSAMLIVSMAFCLPFVIITHGDNKVPAMYSSAEPSTNDKPVAGIGGIRSITAPFDNGLSLLIVTLLGVGFLKAFEKKQRQQDNTPAVTEKIY